MSALEAVDPRVGNIVGGLGDELRARNKGVSESLASKIRHRDEKRRTFCRVVAVHLVMANGGAVDGIMPPEPFGVSPPVPCQLHVASSAWSLGCMNPLTKYSLLEGQSVRRGCDGPHAERAAAVPASRVLRERSVREGWRASRGGALPACDWMRAGRERPTRWQRQRRVISTPCLGGWKGRGRRMVSRWSSVGVERKLEATHFPAPFSARLLLCKGWF